MNVPRSFLLAVMITTLSSPPVHAEEGDIELAKQHFILGKKLFARSDFEAALKQFQKSFSYSKRPALLYNIARCHESMGQVRPAIDAYTRFLESDPPNAKLVRFRVNNLRRREAQSTATSQPTPTEPGPEPASEDRPATGGALGIAGWALVGAGGALLATGAILGGVAGARARELEDASDIQSPPDFAEYESVESSGRALQTGQIVTLALGGAAAAAGAVLLMLHYHRSAGERDEQAAWIGPTLAPRGALVAGGFRF